MCAILVLSFSLGAFADQGASGYQIIATYKIPQQSPLIDVQISSVHSNNVGAPYGYVKHQNIVIKTLAGYVQVANLHVWSEPCKKGKSVKDIHLFDNSRGINITICESDLDSAKRALQNSLESIGYGLSTVLKDLGFAAAGIAIVSALYTLAEWIIVHLWWVLMFA